MISFRKIAEILCIRKPDAVAELKGDEEHKGINGEVFFYQMRDSVLIAANISGFPNDKIACSRGIYGFHLHEGTSCSGNDQDPFADARGHYDTLGCPHPRHAGDFPPVFADGEQALLIFLNNRLDVDEIIGRTVILHAMPDDLMTQPSGNAGRKIACGVVRKKS